VAKIAQQFLPQQDFVFDDEKGGRHGQNSDSGGVQGRAGSWLYQRENCLAEQAIN
jgi:hypothetical protein